MAENKKALGTVEKREGANVLVVPSTKIAREHLPTLIQLLTLKRVNVVEVRTRDMPVCLITLPPLDVLPAGEFTIK